MKFVESDSIKQLLSQLHNTFFKYINANVSDEKVIQQKISLYLADNYPEIFLNQDKLSFDQSLYNLKNIIKNDPNFKAYLKIKSRTMFVKTFFLEKYYDTLIELRNKIEKKLSER